MTCAAVNTNSGSAMTRCQYMNVPPNWQEASTARFPANVDAVNEGVKQRVKSYERFVVHRVTLDQYNVTYTARARLCCATRLLLVLESMLGGIRESDVAIPK